MISLDAKTHSMPQFIGAPKRNFETANLGIESSAPLALVGWVNPSHTVVPATETIHHSQPPHTKESPRWSKWITKSIFQGTYMSSIPIIIYISHTYFFMLLQFMFKRQNIC